MRTPDPNWARGRPRRSRRDRHRQVGKLLAQQQRPARVLAGQRVDLFGERDTGGTRT